MALLTAYVATFASSFLLSWNLSLRRTILILLGKWPGFNLRLLPLLLLTKGLLLQRAGSNMAPFNFALEANNLGRIFNLFSALFLLVDLGLVLVIGVESKSTLVIGASLNTQHIVKCGLPNMTLFQVFLQKVTWALSSFNSSTWLVSTQILEEVEASLSEQQGKESNSSQDVATL